MKKCRIKKEIQIGVIWLLIFCCTGCSVGTLKEKKIKDVSYRIAKKDEIPEELKKEIEESRKAEMRLSYTDQEKGRGDMYIVRGYGEQETAGYSIRVKACYETENTLVIKTIFLGPTREKRMHKRRTYPYIVIKTAYTEKQIVYE